MSYHSNNGKATTFLRKGIAINRCIRTEAMVAVAIEDLGVVNAYFPDS